MKRLFLPSLVASGVLLALSALPARADTIFLTNANPGVAGNGTVSSPYAEVVITGNTTTGVLTFSIDPLSNPAKFKDFGFNLAPGVSTSDFTFKVDSFSGGAIDGYALTGSGALDGFGKFAEVAGDGGGTADRLSTLTFELDFKVGKFGEAVPASVEAKNKEGNYFALEYFPNSGLTGFVGNNDLNAGHHVHVVSEPSSMVLLGLGGLGLIGCAYQVRRNRKNA